MLGSLNKSNLVIFCITILYVFVMLNAGLYKKDQRVIEHDVHHYYGYLPALFIYDDIKVEKSTYARGDGNYIMWQVPLPENKHSFKMTYGLSILYSPFFFVAHLTANFLDYPTDGYSEPYKLMLLMAMIFFSFIGLLTTKRILQYFSFSDGTIAITIAIIGLTTNLFSYSTLQMPVTHTASFALFAIFIYSLIKYRDDSIFKWLLLLSLSFAIIALIRVSNLILFLFFIFYNKKTVDEVENFSISFREVLTFFIALLILFAPQFYYWHLTTGNWLINPYGKELFYFDNPQIFKGLLSFRKGWLLYTPVMIFALTGLYFKKRIDKIWLALMIYLPLQFYIVFSWWCWWYGGSHGMRPMIDAYALLALPLAAFVEWFKESKTRILIITPLILFFTWLNIFQTFQYEAGSLDYERMNRKVYFMQFGKLEKQPGFDVQLSPVNAESALKGER